MRSMSRKVGDACMAIGLPLMRRMIVVASGVLAVALVAAPVEARVQATQCTVWDAEGILYIGTGRLVTGGRHAQGTCTALVPAPGEPVTFDSESTGFAYYCGNSIGTWSETITADGTATVTCVSQ